MKPGVVTIKLLPPGFADWSGLLGLIRRAFAFMDGIVDPPSSVHALTPEKLKEKAETETVVSAWMDEVLAGCLFADPREDHLYLGKLAVEPVLQGQGIGRRLVAAAQDLARQRNLSRLELQTRVELLGNQQAFARFGFREVARTAHPGFSRPTTVTMRKRLA